MSSKNKSPEAKKCCYHSCVAGNCVYEYWVTTCTYPECDKGMPKGSAYEPKEDKSIGDISEVIEEYLD